MVLDSLVRVFLVKIQLKTVEEINNSIKLCNVSLIAHNLQNLCALK